MIELQRRYLTAILDATTAADLHQSVQNSIALELETCPCISRDHVAEVGRERRDTRHPALGCRRRDVAHAHTALTVLTAVDDRKVARQGAASERYFSFSSRGGCDAFSACSDFVDRYNEIVQHVGF